MYSVFLSQILPIMKPKHVIHVLKNFVYDIVVRKCKPSVQSIPNLLMEITVFHVAKITTLIHYQMIVITCESNQVI